MFKLNPKDEQLLKKAATGEIENDIVFYNCNILNVFTKQFIKGVVYVYDKYISHVEYNINLPLLSSKEYIDCENKFLCPGFIDAHVHIESSLLTPKNYASLVLPLGTTTIIEDSHEIGNVLGKAGIKYMLEAAKDLPMRQLTSVPSCIPSLIGLENSGATLYAHDYKDLLEDPHVIGLGEVMDYEGVIHHEKRICDILDIAKDKNVYIQGHAPMLKGTKLSAYLCAGASSDHEAKTFDEVIEKYRKGMWIDIRDANTSRNMKTIVKALSTIGNYDRVCFSSDDRRCNVIMKEGHLDGIVRNAIEAGMPVIDALICASYHVSQEMSIKRLGAIAPGYVADMIRIDDLKHIKVSDVYFEGKLVSKNQQLISPISDKSLELETRNTINISEYSLNDFIIHIDDDRESIRLNYFTYESYTSSTTFPKVDDFKVKDGIVNLEGKEDMMFVIVFNRYGKSNKAIAIVEKFGIDHGAIASSVAHDSHNVTIVFDTPENGMLALQQLIKQRGGMCAVEDGVLIESLPLPLGGLMSLGNAKETATKLEKMTIANKRLGNVYIDNPVSRITILSLLVGPYLKLSDMGMVLTEEKRFLPLFAGTKE